MMMTQTQRGDQARALRWGWWHIECFKLAYLDEVPHGSFDDLFSPGYTYKTAHTFTDPADGEILDILPGDRFQWWWN